MSGYIVICKFINRGLKMSKEKEAVKSTETEADKIWDEIKCKQIAMFALPGQVVEQHVEKLPVPGNQLLIKMKSSAVLPALEQALADKFEITLNNEYITISRKVVSPKF
jgi:hypothetical protein